MERSDFQRNITILDITDATNNFDDVGVNEINKRNSSSMKRDQENGVPQEHHKLVGFTLSMNKIKALLKKKWISTIRKKFSFLLVSQ